MAKTLVNSKSKGKMRLTKDLAFKAELPSNCSFLYPTALESLIALIALVLCMVRGILDCVLRASDNASDSEAR
jgi:hypothetical protein